MPARHAAAVTELEIEQLQLAVEWAALHPGDARGRDGRRGPTGTSRSPATARPRWRSSRSRSSRSRSGCPPTRASTYVGDAVELCHRLPRLWARVMAGEVAVWKARKVAAARPSRCPWTPPRTWTGTSPRGAQVLVRADRRTVDDGPRRVRPRRGRGPPGRGRREAALRRRTCDQVSYDGLVHVDGRRSTSPTPSPSTRLITARAATLDPDTPAGRAPVDGRRPPRHRRRRRQREVVVYTHTRPDTAMVEVENTRTTVTPEQLRIWCQHAGTKVTVRPVLDLNEELTTDSYEPTDRQKEQAWLIHPTCVVPALHPTHPGRGHRPHHRVAPGRPPAPTSRRCADGTTDSRPTPPGPTAAPAPGPSPGPARRATPTRSSPTDISADPHPADHGRRVNSHVRARHEPRGSRHVRSK